eukprot:scaffold293_cov267-Prasinococcus_capsulatus_cf.AAC.9
MQFPVPGTVDSRCRIGTALDWPTIRQRSLGLESMQQLSWQGSTRPVYCPYPDLARKVIALIQECLNAAPCGMYARVVHGNESLCPCDVKSHSQPPCSSWHWASILTVSPPQRQLRAADQLDRAELPVG